MHPFITKHKTMQTPRIVDKNTSLVIFAFNYISFINPLQIRKMAMAEHDLYSAIDVLFEGNFFFI